MSEGETDWVTYPQIVTPIKVITDPATGKTRDGGRMCRCYARMTVQVYGGRRTKRTTQRIGVMAFGDAADALAKIGRGEQALVSGHMQYSDWKGNAGDLIRTMSIIASGGRENVLPYGPPDQLDGSEAEGAD